VTSHRKEMRLTPYILLFSLAGCGDAFVTELKTADGQIRITIKDPSECDESRDIYGIVTGVSRQQRPQRIGLRNVACSNEVNADYFVMLEGMNWCAIANSDVIKQRLNPPLAAVSLIIDRDLGKIHVVDGSEFSDCPDSIKESVAAAVEGLQPKVGLH